MFTPDVVGERKVRPYISAVFDWLGSGIAPIAATIAGIWEIFHYNKHPGNFQ